MSAQATTEAEGWRSTISRARFGRERCGVATWPRAEGESWVIPQPAVLRATDEKSTIAKGAPLAFVLEAMPDLARGSICVAGRRPDGAMHLEPVANQPDVLWIPDRAKRLQERHSGSMWLDPKGPLGYLVDPLREAGVPVSLFDAADLKDAATWLYTGMNPQPVAPDDEQVLGIRPRLFAEYDPGPIRFGGVGGEADHFVAEGGLVDGGGFTVRYARRICLPRGDLDLELGAETTAELDGRARRQRRDVVVALVGHRQTSVRWKEEKLRLAVGPRWPW